MSRLTSGTGPRRALRWVEMPRARFILNRGRWLTSHAAFREDPVGLVARLARWQVALATGRPVIARLHSGIELRCTPSYRRGVDGLIYILRDHYEPEVSWVRNVIQPGMTVVDGGAHMGFYTLLMAQQVGLSGRVVALEPAPATYQRLVANLSRNRELASSVDVHNVALADFTGSAELELARQPGKNRLRQFPGATTSTARVGCTTLDDVLETGDIDFLKLDLEGGELNALRGAERVLRTNPGLQILCELNPRNHGHLGQAELIRFFREIGYELYRYVPATRRLVALTDPETYHGNAVVLPRARR